MTTTQLVNIATQFRQAIVTAKEDHAFKINDRMNCFPRGCCDDTADLFAHYLYEKYGILSFRVDGSYHDGNPEHNCGHSWQEIDDLLIDLTGSQYCNDPVFLNYNRDVYVGPTDKFHELFEIERKMYSRGIEDLADSCWDRMYDLYKTITHYIK